METPKELQELEVPKWSSRGRRGHQMITWGTRGTPKNKLKCRETPKGDLRPERFKDSTRVGVGGAVGPQRDSPVG